MLHSVYKSRVASHKLCKLKSYSEKFWAITAQKISENGRPLNNFAGVGITQKGIVKGQISEIKFQALPD
jgi:hypothetical protein